MNDERFFFEKFIVHHSSFFSEFQSLVAGVQGRQWTPWGSFVPLAPGVSG